MRLPSGLNNHLSLSTLSIKTLVTFLYLSGRGGIRTLDGREAAGFQDLCTKPLCDPSSNASYCIIHTLVVVLVFPALRLVYDDLMMESAATAPRRTSSEYLADSQQLSDNTQMDPVPTDAEMADAAEEYDRYPDIEPQQSRIAPGLYRPMPEEEVLAWEAPNRPFKARSRRFFTTILVIGLLVSMILFFAGQVLPVAVVFSIIFMVYMLSVVPPTQVTIKITTYGIRLDSELFLWEELGRFWFETKLGQKIVTIETSKFPGRITLLLAEMPEELIEAIFSEVLLKERPPLTQFERIGQWLEDRIPLDID